MSAKIALKSIFFLLGWIFIVLGAIGAVLPIVPTVPFLLLAAYFFSKSSPRVHSWLTSLPYFGDAIMDWEKNKVIRPQAKLAAIFCIIVTFGASIIFAKIHQSLKIMLVLIAILCTLFIATRKSSPDN